MAARGWQVFGIDQYAQAKLVGLELPFPIHVGTIESAGLVPDTFDVITFWWSLEHMPQPRAALRSAQRLLKPGGTLIIGVPNISSVEARLFGDYWYHLNAPLHLSHFTAQTLKGVIESVGLDVYSVRQDALSFGLVGSLENWIRHRWLPRLQLRSLLWHYLSMPWDLFMAAVARSSGLITVYATKPISVGQQIGDI